MKKRWMIISICLLMLISYSIFGLSKIRTQTDIVAISLSPYTLYDDPYRNINLLGADDTEAVKEVLMDIADTSKVSFKLSIVNSLEATSVKHYWYLQDEKYLSIGTGLNKDIDLETFNSLDQPIINNRSDEYYFDFPLDNYYYHIYPFHIYSESNLSEYITIFAESEENLNEFTRGLGERDIVYVESNPSDYQVSLMDKLRAIVFLNPLVPLAFGLFLIVIFTSLYQDRRNLSIKLVNGYSKSQYIVEKIKSLLWLQISIFIGGFILYYLFSFGLNFRHFIPMASYYIPIILIINLLTMAFLAIIVYSFTDINQTTYVQGAKPKALTSYIISLAKFAMGLLICITLIPTFSRLVYSVSIYQSLSQQADKYSNMYVLDTGGSYAHSMLAKSDEIIDALKDFDNIIYQSHFGGGQSQASQKVVYVNDNYLKMHPLLDENKNPIDPNKTNVVYTKGHNIEGVEMLKQFPGFLCDSQNNCFHIETIVLDEDARLTMYNKDPFVDDEDISQDFILVPQSEGFYILEIYFVFEDNRQIEEVRNQLEGIVDIESISFHKATDSWQLEIDIAKEQIKNDTIIAMNYLIIMVILSLIYYQIKFDKVRKEFSIYWLNGISKFSYFYRDYFYQIILSGAMILLVRKILYPDFSYLLTFILFLMYLSIDTISLAIFRHQFYSQLQKNVKELV